MLAGLCAAAVIVVVALLWPRHEPATKAAAHADAGAAAGTARGGKATAVDDLTKNQSNKDSLRSQGSETELGKLFASAAECGDRYRCEPLKVLTSLAARPGSDAALPPVVRFALSLWAAPTTQQEDPQVRIADAVLRSFAESIAAPRPDADAQQRLLGEELQRTLATCNASVRPVVYGFLGSPAEFKLSQAEALLSREAERPDRSEEDVALAARSLAAYGGALALARRWVAAGTPHAARAAVGLLGGYAADGPADAAAVRELLATLAGNPQLPADAGLRLLDHLADMQDRTLLHSAAKLEHHTDATVRQRASRVVAELSKR